MLFDEWLKITEEFFRNEGRAMSLPSNKIRSQLEDFNKNLPKSLYKPPLSAIFMALEGVGVGGELSFDRLRKNLFVAAPIANELVLLSSYPNIL